MKQIPNFPNYSITEDGQVWSSARRQIKLRVPSLDKDGYPQISLFAGGTIKTFKVHRLVALTFIPNPDNLPEINHIDGNKLNNRVSNLEWCTSKHNKLHALRIGLRVPQKGEEAHKAKLTEDDVRTIRAGQRGKCYEKTLALKFCVSPSTVRDVVSRRTWKHI